MGHDLRVLLRWSVGRADAPPAVILDSATRQSTPESGHRAGYDGHTKRRGSKIHAAAEHGIRLEVVKLEAVKRGFVLLPRRWVVERSFAWATRFRRSDENRAVGLYVELTRR